MGIFDRFRKKKATPPGEELASQEYKPQYSEECKLIWKNYVPESGPSTNLHGELLRLVEKLRWEAQNNGNINWDDDFDYFCDFLCEHLCNGASTEGEENAKAQLALKRIKFHGQYAQSYVDGKIPDREVDMMLLAHVGDNLYDILADAVGRMYSKHTSPIEYSHNKQICR